MPVIIMMTIMDMFFCSSSTRPNAPMMNSIGKTPFVRLFIACGLRDMNPLM